MLRKIGVIIAASAAAVSLLGAVPARADDTPKSVSETGPNRASHHDTAPTQKGARAKRMHKGAKRGKTGAQSPSSVSDAGPNRGSQHDATPTEIGARAKRMAPNQGKTGSSNNPSSVSESGPNPGSQHDAGPTQRPTGR